MSHPGDLLEGRVRGWHSGSQTQYEDVGGLFCKLVFYSSWFFSDTLVTSALASISRRDNYLPVLRTHGQMAGGLASVQNRCRGAHLNGAVCGWRGGHCSLYEAKCVYIGMYVLSSDWFGVFG